MQCRHCGKDWSENIIYIHEDRCEQNPANMPDEEDVEETVKQFHTGGGYYELPGMDEKVQGKEKAIEVLEEGEN